MRQADVDPQTEELGDKPKVTLHLARDPNDPRVLKGTVLEAHKKGEALNTLLSTPLHGKLEVIENKE